MCFANLVVLSGIVRETGEISPDDKGSKEDAWVDVSGSLGTGGEGEVPGSFILGGEGEVTGRTGTGGEGEVTGGCITGGEGEVTGLTGKYISLAFWILGKAIIVTFFFLKSDLFE